MTGCDYLVEAEMSESRFTEKFWLREDFGKLSERAAREFGDRGNSDTRDPKAARYLLCICNAKRGKREEMLWN